MFFDQVFTIVHNSGKVEFVEDLYQYADNMFVNRFYMNMQYHEKVEKNPLRYCGAYEYCTSEGFFLYSQNGVMISPELFMEEYLNARAEYWNKHYNSRKMKRQWRNTHTIGRYKKPKTLAAKRAACAVVKEEGEPEFRCARQNSSLSTFWDDIHVRSSCGWKTSTKRKRQFKGS